MTKMRFQEPALVTNRNQKKIALIGVPTEGGAAHCGPSMGPLALRRAGIRDALARLGHDAEDHGDLIPAAVSGIQAQNPRVKHLNQAAGWTRRLMPLVEALLRENVLPVWLGGDHSLSLGTVAGAAAHARSIGRRLFVLWLDAHPDFNTFETTPSGNIHGVSAAFFCGLPGFDAVLCRLRDAHVETAHVMMLGIRSVDDGERGLLQEHGVRVHEMGATKRMGAARLLRPFLEEVAAARGLLHVSLDVDFLDPAIAPATGTPVPGGATFGEAEEIMELLRDSGLVTSLDIAELNPLLDREGRTARLVVDLVGKLFGRTAAPRRPLSRRSAEMLNHARN
jgi:arginase